VSIVSTSPSNASSNASHDNRPLAVVSGASAGIGAATARRLAAAGFRLVLGARRLDRVERLVAEIDGQSGGQSGGESGGDPGGESGGQPTGESGGDPGGESGGQPTGESGGQPTGESSGGYRALPQDVTGGHRALPLDVTDAASVEAFCAAIPHDAPCRVLVNNAGGALGLEPVQEADEEHWRWMWEVNVLGMVRLTKALLPRLVASGDGHVVTVTSIAATETYDGGAGYTSAKHAQSAVHRTLRGELLGQPVRFTEVIPGMVQTDFSLHRFGGDTERADAVYRGVTPLTAEDVADVIAFAVTRPSHVNLDQIVLKPRDQISVARIHRRT
jgi:NADP-dependent 3-hydroxy acid dehydrogenase YdfG